MLDNKILAHNSTLKNQLFLIFNELQNMLQKSNIRLSRSEAAV